MGSLGRVGRTVASIMMEQCLYCNNTYATSKGGAGRRTRCCGEKSCIGKASTRQENTFLRAKPRHNFEMLRARNNNEIRKYGHAKIFNSPFRKS